MKFEKQSIESIYVLRPNVISDHRGFFMESYRKDVFSEQGFNFDFVQDNHSRSAKGTLRGLHFQWDPPMGKLMRVTRGRAFLVAVDIRKNSGTLGEWFGIEVTEENKIQVFAPAGIARGFLALSDVTEIQYKCTGIYNSNAESGIKWNDRKIGIKWPIENPILSDKDMKQQSFNEWLDSPQSDNFLL